MAATTKAGRTHYELLGLRPEATGEEIRQAFFRELTGLRPHAVGGLAQATVAYEVLRDPIKRRAYDASLQPKVEAPRAPPRDNRNPP